MPQYQYRALSKKLDSIRLLRLLPAAGQEAEIRAELLEYNLDEFQGSSHPYEALSYVWGDPSRSRSIFLEGELFKVTSNLYAALLQLRDHSFPRIIWIDAICINQLDDDERGLQVRFMANIYGNAKRVIVWLGEAADSSDEALEAIRCVGMNPGEVSKSSVIEDAVVTLLQREWFERVWVLQEVAAARHVVMICGTTELDGYAFCSGLEHPEFSRTHKNSRHAQVRAVTSLIRGAIFRPKFRSSAMGRATLNICSLVELMSMYSTHKATLRHDKIYALIGMATDNVSDAGLMPDYRVPWEDLLQRLIHFVLGKEIRVETRAEEEKADIYGRGCVIGRVWEATRTPSGSQTISVKLYHNVVKISKRERYDETFLVWTVQATINDVRKNDAIYLLNRATKPMIIRQYRGHHHIITMVTPPRDIIPIGSFQGNLTLIWDWAKFSGDVVKTKSDQTTALILRDLGHCSEVEE